MTLRPRLICLAVLTITFTLSGTPVVAQELPDTAAPPLADVLDVAMAFTEEVYGANEVAHLKITLTNSGEAALAGIVAVCEPGAGFSLKGTGPGWGALASDGVAVGAGETRLFEVSELPTANTPDVFQVTADCTFGPRDSDDRVRATATARWHALLKLVGRVVHTPESRPPQGVAGFRILITDISCNIAAEDISDATGHFELRNIPVRRMLLFVIPPAGWDTVPPQRRVGIGPGRTDTFPFGDSPLTINAAPSTDTNLPLSPCLAPPSTSPTAPPATPAPQARPASELAATGANTTGLGLLGLLTVVLGAILRFTARRRPAC